MSGQLRLIQMDATSIRRTIHNAKLAGQRLSREKRAQLRASMKGSSKKNVAIYEEQKDEEVSLVFGG